MTEKHILTVVHREDGTVEYSLEHPGCRVYDTHAYDPDEDGHTHEASVYASTSVECGVGLMIQDAGFLDAIGVTSWGPGLNHVTEHLAPGKYELEVWTRHYPSTPNGPEEWDSGMYVEPIKEEDEA